MTIFLELLRVNNQIVRKYTKKLQEIIADKENINVNIIILKVKSRIKTKFWNFSSRICEYVNTMTNSMGKFG